MTHVQSCTPSSVSRISIGQFSCWNKSPQAQPLNDSIWDHDHWLNLKIGKKYWHIQIYQLKLSGVNFGPRSSCRELSSDPLTLTQCSEFEERFCAEVSSPLKGTWVFNHAFDHWHLSLLGLRPSGLRRHSESCFPRKEAMSDHVALQIQEVR